MHRKYFARPSSFTSEGDTQCTGTHFHLSDNGEGLISKNDVQSVQEVELAYPKGNI